MKIASVSDFTEHLESKIIIHSKWFYIFRLGGFFIAVIIPLFGLIFGVATGDIKHAVIFMFCMAPIGFLGFILSFNAPSSCKFCSGRLETYWSNEVRANERYTGTISVCNQCKKYEARITRDFD
jgi:hypothetical protein